MASVSTYLRLLKSRTLKRGLRSTFNLSRQYLRNFFEHSTPRKMVNLLLAKAQKYLKIDRVISMPYIYTIDPINTCNLRCPLCPTGLGTLGRKRGKLSFENYTNIIDQVKPYAYKVYLYNWGEPFLHPDIFDIIHYASTRRIEVHLSSNLNHFSQNMAQNLVASGLDTLLVSIDGLSQEVYEKYRRKGDVTKVINHIRMIVDEKRRTGSIKPFITMRMLVNRYNENEVEQMREVVKELGADAFTLGVLYVDTQNPEQVKEWLPSQQQFSAYDYSANQLTNVWHCSDLWESMTINWDGGTAPCCWLHDHKNDFFNAFSKPIRELWNSEAYISSRRVFAFGGPKAGPVETICTKCKGRPLYLKD
jgi:MoaA/NifB/PqqE/SkfB family radical SAM enzyme